MSRFSPRDLLWAVAFTTLVGCGKQTSSANTASGAGGNSGFSGSNAATNATGGNAGPSGGAQNANTADAGNFSPAGGLRAFPGAEGFGTETIGGRRGKVYVVTTLDFEGPGSFSEALFATEPRTIVFRVSGVIDVPVGGPVLEEAHSFVTVAGQTSPGGITLRGAGATLESYQAGFHDGVFRFLRFRGNGNYDNVSFNTTHNLVFDHCDFSGAEDEALDITFSHDFTIQWSTVTNSGPGGQVYGQLLAYPPTSHITMHHNLSAHHSNRCGPHMHWGENGEAPAEGALFDYRNNVIYNCAFEKGMDITSPTTGTLQFNIVGNTAKAGPNTPNEGNTALMGIGDTASVYEHDNVYQPGLPIFTIYSTPTLVSDAFDFPAVTTQAADVAFEAVLNQAGAWPRDPMNTRTVSEVRAGTGALGNVSDALIESGPEAPSDADVDGMADDWETAHQLDPADPADNNADADGDGYTNIEQYINELAAQQVGNR